jgi:hypothetical protein
MVTLPPGNAGGLQHRMWRDILLVTITNNTESSV